MKGNVIQMNTLHLNSVRLNGIGKVQSVSLKGGSTEDPVFPPVEPPVEPTPTYTLSASVTNGKVSAKRNGSAVNLPFTANEGDTIVLSVQPNEGYEFNGWNDGNTDNPRSITMNADVALSAQCVEVVVPPAKEYIQFEDAEVERVLMSKGVSSDGVGITMEDAAKVTSISTWFKGNTAITSFEELEYFTGLTFLGTGSMSTNGAFYGCTSLQSVKIPSSVTRLALGAFQGCSSLKSVGSLSNVKQIEIAAFKGCALEGEISLDSAEGTIGYSAFEGNKFTKVASLGNATTLDGTTPIGSGAFGHCENMQSIDLSKVQTLSTGALSYCNSLEEAILPMVADIRMYAFYYDSSLKKVDIGSNVTHIGTFAFNNCTSLATFICRATTPPTLDNANAFQNTNTCPIYVPDASLEAYKTAVNWSAYADRIHPLSEIEGVVIEYGYELSQRGSLVENDNCCVVGFVKCDVGISVRWGVTSGSYGRLCEYDSTGECEDFWDSRSGISRTITISSNSSLLKATFPIDYVDNAYIYDDTNGKYLWKGKNVE